MSRTADEESIVIAACGAAVIVLIVGFVARPRPPARVPVSPASVPATSQRPVIRRRSKRPAAIQAADVAGWCESLARVVRGGSTLTSALRTIEPPATCHSMIDPVTLALERGRSLDAALAIRSPSPHLMLALGVLRACAVNGGPPAEPLDRAAATLRARAVVASERRTQSAQARMSAVVMTVLPVAMLALLLLTSSSTRTAAASPLGVVAVTVGIVLNLAGWRWMRGIVDGKLT